MSISEKDHRKLLEQLGREPEGALRIVSYGNDQEPQVVEVSPWVRKTPFPTIYWLSCPRLKKEISRLEASGLVKKLENWLSKSTQMQQASRATHLNYIEKRKELFSKNLKNSEKKLIPEDFHKKGVGGIADFKRVRCLHMHYAHFLVDDNFIGSIIKEALAGKVITSELCESLADVFLKRITKGQVEE